MNEIATTETSTLPALVDRAATALAAARSSAEVLEARDMASLAYDAAKRVARFANAKNAADTLIAAAHRAQADALDIEARAKRRLADEYDAAQERGEVATAGKRSQAERLVEAPPSVADIGLSRKDIHEARIIRDAEIADPGIVRRTVDAAITDGEEPTKSKIRRATRQAAGLNATSAKPAAARGKDRHRDKVIDALSLLYGLPPAAEVAGYFDRHDAGLIIDERLPTVLSWLSDFARTWRTQNV